MRAADPAQVTLLVNPSAGHGVAHLMAPRLARTLIRGLPESQIRVLMSTSSADAAQLAREAARSARPVAPGRRPDVLCVVGGDGTANIGLNACAGTTTQLAVIPAGTGDDFVRGIGAPRRADRAISAVLSGRSRRIDLLLAAGALTPGSRQRRVGSVVSTGYDAAVNMRVNRSPCDLGRLSYAWAVFSELRRFSPLHYRMVLDGGAERSFEAMLVAVGNAGFIGGGIRICPDADPADGMLDVTLVHPVGVSTLARQFPALYSGRFAAIDAVETFRCRSVRLDGDWSCATADGEELGRAPLDLSVDPGCVEVLVGP